MKIGENITRYRKLCNMSGEELGRRLGISRQTVYRYECGKIENIPREKVEKIAEILGVSPAQLLGWESTLPTSRADISLPAQSEVPLVSQVACDGPVFGGESWPLYAAEGENGLVQADLKADFCLRMRGDSMTGARINDGDMVFVHAQSMVCNGEIAVISLKGEVVLKRVYYYPETRKLVLLPENTSFEPLVYEGSDLNEVRILGKAIAFQSRVR